MTSRAGPYVISSVSYVLSLYCHTTTQPQVHDLKQQPFMAPPESMGQLGRLAILGWGSCPGIPSQLVGQLGAG